MMRGMTILWTGLAVIIGIGLFLLKYEVRSLEGHLAQVNRDIRGNQEAIHVLKAEWSYLNDPERLRDLNERHLAMKPFRGDQLASIADLPMAPPQPTDPPAVEAPLQPTPPEGRVMVEAPQAPPAAPATRSIKPVETTIAKAPAPAPAPARSEPPRTVVASAPAAAPVPAKPMPLKTETTPKPLVGKSEPVRSEALQSAFAAAKPANPKPVPTTPARLPTGGVVTSAPSADVMVIKSPALVAAEAAARGNR